MSEEQNVELLRTAFRAFESGDIEGVLGLCHEDIEITQPVELSDAAPRQRGHEGVLEAFAIWPEQCVVSSDLRGDGAVGEVRFFLTWREALDAVGLSR